MPAAIYYWKHAIEPSEAISMLHSIGALELCDAFKG